MTHAEYLKSRPRPRPEPHAQARAWERYGLILTRSDLRRLATLLTFGSGPGLRFAGISGGRERWLVAADLLGAGGGPVPVIFDRCRQKVMTVLPREG